MFNDKFSVDQQTGPKEGRRSCIISGKELQFGRAIMVKKTLVNTKEHKESCCKEVEYLKKCAHEPNIVQIMHSVYENDYHYIAMERGMICLRKLLLKVENRDGLSQEILLDFIQDSTDALCFLHKEGIGHSEIAAENIIVFKHYKDSGRNSDILFKLSNFGIPRKIELTGAAEELENMLPKISDRPTHSRSMEFRIGRNYTVAEIDLWFLGCLLFECTTGMRPFPNCHVYSDDYKNCINALCSEGIWARKEDGSNNFTYHKDLPPTHHSSWFRRYVKGLISTMFHRGTMDNVNRIVEDQRTASILTLIFVEPPKIMRRCSYVDLTENDVLTIGYPTMSDEIGGTIRGKEYYAVSKSGVQNLNKFTPCDSMVYIILQKPSRTNLYSKEPLIPDSNHDDCNLNEYLFQAHKYSKETNDMIESYEDTVSILKHYFRKFGSKYKRDIPFYVDEVNNRLDYIDKLRTNIEYGILATEGDVREKLYQLRTDVEISKQKLENMQKIGTYIQTSNGILQKNILEEYYREYIDVEDTKNEEHVKQLHTECLTKRNSLWEKLVDVFNGDSGAGAGGILHCLQMAILCDKGLHPDAIHYCKDTYNTLHNITTEFQRLMPAEYSNNNESTLHGSINRAMAEMSLRHYETAKKYSIQQQTNP